ncbi:MAG: ABC transporter substrate-binding protein [Planctomycetota bacterium]|nr:MAG: ABC transporter substrate-binding protein [Planctomycetota bacterium]
MNLRLALPLVVLGLPAALLLAFGPRGRTHAPPDRVVLRYWEKWTGVEGAAIQRIVDRYNATAGAEAGIWVAYTALGDVDKRMLIATAGGDPPDLAGLPDRFLASYADRGALMPLDDLVAEAGIDLAQFQPIWLDICRYRDVLYALPSTPFTIALFYNREMFRRAGLDPDRPPQTTGELNEYFTKLTRIEGGRIVQCGFTTSPAMLGWWHWVWPYFFGDDYLRDSSTLIDTPPTHAALDWIVRRRSSVGNDRMLDFEATAGAIESAQNPFLSGRLAMVFQGPWMANWARVYAPDLDYGVAAFPGATPERTPVFASCDVFVIPRGARHVKEVMHFLKYVMRQENLEELCRSHGKVSPFRTPQPAFFENHPNPQIRAFEQLAASPDTFGFPKMPTFAQAEAITFEMLDSVLRRTAAPEDAIRTAERKLRDVVTEYERMAALRGRRTDETPARAAEARP